MTDFISSTANDAASPHEEPAVRAAPGTRVRVRVEDAAVPMSDGTLLAADVAVPDDGLPHPTILVRSPYSRAGARLGADPVGTAREGWSVVVQDVRGRFDSQGEFHPFAQEAQDGAETIRWCAEQPWSDGRVVTMGASYDGLTQLFAASATPPEHGAMGLIVTSALLDESVMGEGGAFPLGWMLPWAVMMGSLDPNETPEHMVHGIELLGDVDALYAHPLGDHPVREFFPPLAEWLHTETPPWRTAMEEALPTMTAAGFHVAGWFDVFCDGSLKTWQRLADRHAAGEGPPQRMVVGPWTHVGIFQPTTPEVDFGVTANGAPLREEMLTWMRAVIDGEEVEVGARLFIMGTNEWIDVAAWPPPSDPTTVWLHATTGSNSLAGDGVLRWDPPTTDHVDRFDYDPFDPVPTRGGCVLGPILPWAGPVDQRPVEERDDVLVYTSEPLEADLTVIGNVAADIRFATSGRSADVTVKLVDVHPDGRAMCVTDSVLRHDFVPGEHQDVHVEVGGTAMCFLAGHRLRVEISSSNFPRLDRNPSTGEPAGQATRLEGARQQVHLGGASRITLPVALAVQDAGRDSD